MKGVGILLNPATNDLDIKVRKDAYGNIVQGLRIGGVTPQNISIILYAQPGELKEVPTVGVGISNALLDKDYLLYKHKIRQQLGAEGMRVNYLDINGQGIGLDADYK